MRYTSFLPFLLLALLSCKSEYNPIPFQRVVHRCGDSRYSRTNEFTNLKTTVLKLGTGNEVEYILERPDTIKAILPVALTPCGLPEAYKRDKLSVRVSGYVLNYSGMLIDSISRIPFEITKIEEL